MNEYPIFVPYEGEHLAAVLTVPDGDPRGVALLMCGLGAPRSHRYQMWTRTARRIADSGIAALRMDYVGIGDSTGAVREFRMGDEARSLAEAKAVLDVGVRALGVERVALAGNCLGSRVALALASERPEVVGAAGILPPLVSPSAMKSRLSKAKRSRAARMVRSNPFLRKTVLKRLREMDGQAPSTIKDWFAGTLDHARILFIFGEDDHRLTDRMQSQIDAMLMTMPPEIRSRYELKVLPQGPLAGFESIEIQEAVIDTVAGFVVETITSPVSRGVAPRPAAAAS